MAKLQITLLSFTFIQCSSLVSLHQNCAISGLQKDIILIYAMWD